MMTSIFSLMILSGIAIAALTGRMAAVSAAALSDSGRAVQLVLSLTGNFCLWSGMMQIAQEAGLTDRLAALARPLTRRLFRGLRTEGEAMRAVTMNLAANLLGLGSAATPLGIRAMRAMAKEERADGAATDNMALFVVMNTASLQLIPTTNALLRAQAGAAKPLDILPAVWFSTFCSLSAGLLAASLLRRFSWDQCLP